MQVLWSNTRIKHKGEVIAVLSIGTDITEWKQLEKSLSESEQKYRLLTENIPTVVWVTDEDGHTSFISDNIKRVYGYSPEEIYERGEELWFGRIHKEDVEKVGQAFKSLFSSDKKYDVEYRIQRKDGSWIWLHDMAEIYKTKDGKRFAYGVFTDATERIKAQEGLKESQEKYLDLYNNAPAMFASVDHKTGNVIECNRMLINSTGYSKNEIIGKSVLDRYHADSLDDAQKAFASFKKTGRVENAELILKKKGREKIDVLLNVTSVKDDKGRIMYSRSVWQDVTDRKKALNALKESEEKRRTWIDNSPVCTKIVDLDFNLQFMSESGAKDLKIEDVNKLYGKPYPFHFYPDSFKVLMTKNLKKAKKTGEIVTQEASVLDTKGNQLWYHSTIVPVNDDKGRLDYFLVVSIETTVREKALEALKRSEEKFRSYVDNAPDAIFVVDKRGDYVDVNPAGLRLTGYSREELLKKNIADITASEAEGVAQKEFGQLLSTGKGAVELPYIRKDGVKRFWAVEGIGIGGERFLGFCKDITERKFAEKEIESIAKFPEENPNPVFRISNDGEVLYANEAASTLFKFWHMKVGGKVAKLWKGEMSTAIKSGKTGLHRVTVNELTFSFEIAPILEGEYVNFYGRDITAQVVAQNALVNSEKKYRSLFENMATGFAYHKMVYDKVGKPTDYTFLELNERFEDLTGLSRKKILGKTVKEAVPGIEKDEFDWIGTYGKIAKEGGSIILEDQYSTPLNRWYSVVAYSPGKDYFATVFVDVTERKKTEDALAQEKSFTERTINSIPGIFYVFGKDGHFLRWNKNYESISEYSGEEISKMNPLDFFSKEDKQGIKDAIGEVFTKGFVTVESNFQTKSGKKIPHIFTGERLEIEGVPHLVGVGTDISDRRKAEVGLRDALQNFEKSNKDLTRLNNFMVGREMKMRELKKEIQRLKARLGEE